MHETRRSRGAMRRTIAAVAAIITAAVLTPTAASAQNASLGTVTGKVTDGASGRGLSGAYVVIVGSQQGVVTAEDGSYRILLRPGTHDLRARLIGFGSVNATVTVTAGGQTNQDFVLPKTVVNLGEVAVVGTRAQERSVTTAPVPVDVVGAAELQSAGVTETNQAIQMLAPSFNFPRPSIADGSDHVRPATLRGLGPDQVLVLVNGKRRYQSALVNVNGTVGRGSAGVDLNAIPLSSIDRIEILRDGAAAQYGSDAIAGVMNIVLKSEPRSDATVVAGQTYKGDGETLQAGGSFGLGTAQGSFLNFSGDVRHRGYTNRADADTTSQFFAGDARNTSPQYDNKIRWRQGDALVNEGGGFYNGGMTLGSGIQLYSFGGASYRHGDSPANFRRYNNNGTIRSIYPEGFLPHIESAIWDMSVAGGAKGVWNDWSWDLSSVYGGNRFRYDVTNSDNASLGNASPRDFYAGTMIFTQHTTNLDLTRTMDVGMMSHVTVAGGAELRYDRYKIWAGDNASWVNGNVRIIDGPNAGGLAPAGAQGFPGFQPGDATSAIRNNEAGYLDVEGTVGRAFTWGGAARAERYSDFGSQVTGKVQARVEFAPGYAIRGAIGNGFRAPSLQQEYFSSTATNFIGGVPYDIKTFRPNSAVAAALGAQPLKPEKSVNTSIGLTAEPTRNFSITADGYIIDISDRIVFSDNFITQAFRDTLRNRNPDFATIGGGRFFTNAIDTKTKGLDVVARYGMGFGTAGTLRLTGGANWTKTEATKTLATPQQLSGLDAVLFGPIEKTRIERGQPRRTIHLNGDYDVGNWIFTAHEAYFGTVTAATTVSGVYVEQGYKGKWITDASLSYRLPGSTKLTVGGNNIFNVYPDAVIPGFSNGGVLRYPLVSPWGFNGGYYYTKLAWTPGR
jgi:iron complex outermembrane recepter protein